MLHNICNMCSHDLISLDMSSGLSIHIRYIPPAHVTYIMCNRPQRCFLEAFQKFLKIHVTLREPNFDKVYLVLLYLHQTVIIVGLSLSYSISLKLHFSRILYTYTTSRQLRHTFYRLTSSKPNDCCGFDV